MAPDDGSPRLPRNEWPLWVRLGFWGIKNRRTAWAFVLLSLGSAVFVQVAITPAEPLFAAGFVLAAFLYWLTIRWVDAHGEWG